MDRHSMTFRSYEQVRALHALEAARRQDGTFLGQDGGKNTVKRMPNLIIECGLLGALAFALEKGGGHQAVFEAVREHLASPEIGDRTAVGAADAEAWFRALAEAPSSALRLATAETMAYLTYLRRFANRI